MGTRVSFTEEEEAGRALRKLRIRLVGRSSNEWLALYGNLQNFQRHLEESTIWLYREPVRIRVGEKVWETGTQPALHNGEFRILLTDPDSDMPTWNYDVERFLPLSKDSRYRSLAGEQVEVKLLPSTVAREVEEVGRKIVESAPVVQPMSPAAPVPPETPVRKCPACGAELEKDVIGLVCFCGAELPDDLAVSHVFAVALSHTWEQLPDHQRGRISAAFRRVGKGRKFSRQVHLENMYLMVLLAESEDASNLADQNVLAEVLDELGAGKVLTDSYEIKMIMKMLKERHGEEIWRDA